MRKFLGFLSTFLLCLLTCFWGFWGIMENFHEGWYSSNNLHNLLLLLVQYLSFFMAFWLVSIIAIFFPKISALFIILADIGIAYLALWGRDVWHLKLLVGWAILLVPPFIIALGLMFGTLPSRRARLIWTVILPLFLVIGLSIEPLRRISNRFYDGDYGIREVNTNSVALAYAPQGYGWPNTTEGLDWYQAQERCSMLSYDGKTLEKTPQNIWRLPTIEEAVCSMALHNRNAQGKWDATNKVANYGILPNQKYAILDKEQPMWDPYSPIIYWWTSTEVDAEHAYIIVFNGQVFSRSKKVRMGSLGFRAVRPLDTEKN